MYRYVLLGLLCCFFIENTYAQQTVKGQVFENSTRIPLAGIRIENTRTKIKTETDIKGKFTISAKVNDVLVFQGFAYQPDTLFLGDLKQLEVFLDPSKNMLKQVDVKGVEINTSGWTDPAFHNQTVVYSRNGDGSYKGGVTFRVWSNHSAERKREKQEKQQRTEQMRLQIDGFFSQQNLLRYLPIKPEEVGSFRSRYIPTLAEYTSNDFNLLMYLDSCYKQFMKLPAEKRLANRIELPL